ncbi:DUF4382 domain-containing protein [Piscinibacter sp.]|uniref:DUF4382 domain-containing protein n=1 Tax=Piscinibacter sp. TaxID=1903157 RepID=UPI002F3F35F1
MHPFIRFMRSRAARFLAGVGFGAAALLAGCGGGGGSESGTLRLSLTDAPACGYDNVWVNVQKVRVHHSSSASPSDDGWSEIAVNRRIDLLGLTNGVLDELGQTPLPTGKYQQMRLVLAATGNSVVLSSDHSEVPLTTPSGVQTGIKMNIDIDIAANKMADFVLDFDACKSVVRAGSSGSYLLKPVVSVIAHFVSGVLGFVDTSLAGASVSLQQAGVIVKSTVADSTGKFLLQPVAPGTYDLVVLASGHATAVVTDVVVTTDTVTSINTSTSGLNPPVSTSGTAAGVVTTGATPIDATVNVMQALSGGHTIEVAGAPVDAVTGSYSYALAADAPVVAPFVAPPGPLTFVADAAVAGTYSLAAISGGVTKTAGPITITSGVTVTTDFTFP